MLQCCKFALACSFDDRQCRGPPPDVRRCGGGEFERGTECETDIEGVGSSAAILANDGCKGDGFQRASVDDWRNTGYHRVVGGCPSFVTLSQSRTDSFGSSRAFQRFSVGFC